MQLLLSRIQFTLWLLLFISCQTIAQESAAENVVESSTESVAERVGDIGAQAIRLQVAEPFIELHTGPGRGFPIFHIVERHDWVEILKRRTDWFRIRTRDGKHGWAFIDKLEQTFALPGRKARFSRIQHEDFQKRKYEFGVSVGEFEGASLLTDYSGYKFSKNLLVEVSVSQASGTFTNTVFLNGNLVSSPFPEWKVSPFFTLGAGLIKTKAKKTALVVSELDETTINMGFGVNWYLTRRFVFRADVREYIGFLGQDFNGEFIEWKLGFSFFF